MSGYNHFLRIGGDEGVKPDYARGGEI